MTSSRPYLLRALHAWLLDNDQTPHILVDADVAGVQVPAPYVQNGKIVLNIHPQATEMLEITQDQVSFRARFGGVVHALLVPMAAVLAVYSRENGRGMMFPGLESEDVSGEGEAQSQPSTLSPDDGDKRSHLRIIK